MHQSTPCLHCGKPLPTFSNGKPRKYCSKTCGRAWHTAKNASNAPKTEKCKHCDAPIVQNKYGAPKMYCNAQCRVAWHNANNEAYREKNRARDRENRSPSCLVYFLNCDHCGNLFAARQKNRTWCYDDDCVTEHKRGIQRGKETRYIEKHGHPRRKSKDATGTSVCRWCESEFLVLWTGHTTCSRECSQLVASWGTPQAKRDHIARKLPVLFTGEKTRRVWEPARTYGTCVVVQGPCAVCGDQFTAYQNPTTRTCSPKCRGAWEWARQRRSHGRRADLARIAFVEHVDPDVVYARDGYRCHLCGGDMVMDEAGYHQLMPTLDHIVPISRGGKHCYANVKAAHHVCNSRKGPALYGQYAMTDDELEELVVA